MSSKEANAAPEKKKKESILDLTRFVVSISNINVFILKKTRQFKYTLLVFRYLEKAIRVKFSGGREVSGILKGFDPLVNLVLDNTLEYLRDPDEPMKLTEDTRTLGLVVCRGTSIVLICPVDGMEAIANPFVQQD